MRIICVGTDLAALYLGILLKRQNPAYGVRFIAGAVQTGLPVSLVCNPLRPNLQLKDAETQAAMSEVLGRCDKVVVTAPDQRFESRGFPYAAVDTGALAAQLERLARGLGCTFVPAQELPGPNDADLIVAADGAGSRAREKLGDFKTSLAQSKTRFMTFVSERSTDALAYAFQPTVAGIFHALSCPRGRAGSATIVEAPLAAIREAGIEQASVPDVLAYSRDLFPNALDGARPQAADAGWRPFITVQNEIWHNGNVVLLGAAAYTSHFSVGLELRSWLEDAEALAGALASATSVADALVAYAKARRPKAESLQRAALASLAWFENVAIHIDKPFSQFVFAALTSSMRVNYPRVAKAAPELVREVDALVAAQTPGSNTPSPPPPMFTPYRLRDLVLPNRVVVSPMCMYSAKDGTVNDFHLVHLGSRAMGGAGLVITEMTDVLPEGRISLHCAGMYAPEHVGAWRRIVDFVHAHSASKIGVQLAHAGRKGSLSRSWEGHRPLEEAQWEILAPSAIPFAKGRQVPRAMTRADMDKVRDAFARATQMSDAAGFDMIELHYAHGYLISSFISPLSNRRTDEYGGSLENRMRFPLEVFAAVRAAWPVHKPISTRISALDWIEGGNTIEDAIEIGRMLHEAGNDILAVSTGGVTGEQRPVDGRVYQAAFSDRIRNTLDIPTMAVGGIVSHSDVNTIIAAGRADLCALARGYLADPYFARHSAVAQDYDSPHWPSQYRRSREVRMRYV